jgi:hypothetical protein
MVGARVTDLWLRPQRTGRVATWDAETLSVGVEWRESMVSWLKPADIKAGRYVIEVLA